MKNFFLYVALPVIGLVLLAVFGPASLAIGAKIFGVSGEQVNFATVFEGHYLRFPLATLGVLLLAVCETYHLFAKRAAGTMAATLSGRAVQMIGLGLSCIALLSGMFTMSRLASPDYHATQESLVSGFSVNIPMLMVSLGLVALGQLIVGLGRFYSPESKNAPKGRGAIGTAAQIFALFLVLGLFVFTIIFELSCIAMMTAGELIEVSKLAMNLQGMLIYPFLAYLILAAYCLVDAIRFAVGNLGRSQDR